METTQVSVLVEELLKRPVLCSFDKEKFARLLENIKVGNSSKFHEEFPNETQRIDDCNFIYEFSLRKVLRNGNAKNYQFSKVKQIAASFASDLGIYSSSVLTRNLRADGEILGLMEKSALMGNPFSLLGRLDFFECEIGGGVELERNRPVLIIPGIRGNEANVVYSWESRNTIYRRNGNLVKVR